MASNEQRQEAHNRGIRFGIHCATHRHPRNPGTHVSEALGMLAADPEIRAAYDAGFFAGYDKQRQTTGLDFGDFSKDAATKASTLSAEAQRENAYHYGQDAGEKAAMGKQAKVPSNYYGTVLKEGADMSVPANRAAFDQGFNDGYNKAAMGLGPDATKVLKDITIAESKKVEDMYGARQTDLALRYNDFDNLINSDLSVYGSVDGGLQFLSEWKLAKAEFTARNGHQMSGEELSDSEAKLEQAKQRREELVGGGATKFSLPGILDIFKGKGADPVKTQTTSTNVPAKPGAPAPAGAGLFGLSRNATIGLGVVALAAIGGGVYYATREDKEHIGMVKGPDGVWRPKSRPAALPAR
jgi:hypothetical protein